jgi:hypothetical protein
MPVIRQMQKIQGTDNRETKPAVQVAAGTEEIREADCRSRYKKQEG